MPGQRSRSQAAIPVYLADDDLNPLPSGTDASPAVHANAPLTAGVDRSGTTSATAGTATVLAVANTARKGLDIQNISTGNIGVNEVGGTAVIGAAGTNTILAAGSFRVRTNRTISVVGSAASLAYTATEY